MPTKLCPECNETKDYSEFYKTSYGKPYKHCKPCASRLNQKYAYKRRITDSGVAHEQELIHKLKSLGYYACSGKKSRSRWVDVVVFGCIAIEAKLAQNKNKNGHGFRFSVKQARDGIRAEVVVFIIKRDGVTDYYILPASSPVLYDDNGNLKAYISYTPNSNHGRTSQLMLDTMATAKNNWQLLDEMLQEKRARMMAGEPVVFWTD